MVSHDGGLAQQRATWRDSDGLETGEEVEEAEETQRRLIDHTIV